MIEEHEIVFAGRLKRMKMPASLLYLPHYPADLGYLEGSCDAFRGSLHDSGNLTDWL